MAKLPLAVLAAVLAALPVGASAAPAWTGSADYGRCMDKANGIDAAMADCAGAEFERQDKRLNDVYAKRIAKADDTVREDLKRSQRAWLAHRDASCEAEGAFFEGGTFQPIAEAECRARFTSERTDWLGTLPE